MVIDNLLKKLNTMRNELQSTEKEHGQIEVMLQSKIDSFREEKAKVDQEIKIKENQIKENMADILKMKDDVEQVTIFFFFLTFNN